jgi:hypothetical protein
VSYFCNNYTSVFVNNNGNLTFIGPLGTFTPPPLTQLGVDIIAPFFADVDTRGAGSGVTKYGTGTVNSRPAFGTTWIDVGYYDQHVDKRNSFQFVLISRDDLQPGAFDIEFNYNKVQWEAGDASGGNGGLGGATARAGYAASLGSITYELPGSAEPGEFLDGGALALVSNSVNSSVLGRYVFSVTCEPVVEIVDAFDQPTSTLKVGKWENAFLLNQQNRPYVKDEFISLDPDRFHIRVTDPAKKGQGTVTAKVKTIDSGEYNNGLVDIDLTETPAQSGIFKSKSLLLASDPVDDKWKVDGVNDDAKNDRTFSVALNGKVRVEYSDQSDEANVPAAKVVNLHVTVPKNGELTVVGEPFKEIINPNGLWNQGEGYWDLDGNKAYTARLTEADARTRIERDVKIANERYAQVGVKFIFDPNAIAFPQVPQQIISGVINTSSAPVNGDNNLTDDEKALLQAGFNSASTSDLEIYYVKSITSSNTAFQGWSFASSTYQNMTTPDVNDSLLIANATGLYTLGHEMYHLFDQLAQHSQSKTNLFYNSPTWVIEESLGKVIDTKRLLPSQQAKVYDSEYAVNPP